MKLVPAILLVLLAGTACTPMALAQATTNPHPQAATTARPSRPASSLQAQRKLSTTKSPEVQTAKFMIANGAILDVSRSIPILTRQLDSQRFYWVLHYAGTSGWLEIEEQGVVVRKLPFTIIAADTLKFDAPPREPVTLVLP